jgi:hypothetical protein
VNSEGNGGQKAEAGIRESLVRFSTLTSEGDEKRALESAWCESLPDR